MDSVTFKPVSALVKSLLAVAAVAVATVAGAEDSGELTADKIMQLATAASGGEAWLKAETNLMTGHATLYRGGRAMVADRYEMRRVYPTRLSDAHTTTGKFRLDSYVGDKLMFMISYDGERMYDARGVMPEERAAELAASSFGYSVVRFALEKGFELRREADDQVAGYPSHFVQVTDPSGSKTLVGVDAAQHLIRYVGWQTPRGWHHRIYDDYYKLESGFMQPGHVRLYYDGVKSADIRWTEATVNIDLPDEVFVGGQTP
jgi:hypothetical protein